MNGLCFTIFSTAGFAYAPKRGKGSHIAMYRNQISDNSEKKEHSNGVLLSILKQAGLSNEEFLKLGAF